jgi:hypothetical protein
MVFEGFLVLICVYGGVVSVLESRKSIGLTEDGAGVQALARPT